MHQRQWNTLLNSQISIKIPMQYFVSMGGTDAAKALDLNAGVIATIGLPARYIHSSSSNDGYS